VLATNSTVISATACDNGLGAPTRFKLNNLQRTDLEKSALRRT
jgi:hypothetical protein